MSLPITNPYYSQMYPHYLNAISNGPITLPPCEGACSIGPSAAETDLTVRWTSQNFFITAYDNSKCTLIKDENDIFYYIVAYYTSSEYRVRVNVYDAEADINDVYTITPPAGMTTANLGTIPGWLWTIRKQDGVAALDFVVRGLTATDYVYQHYTWTIGDAAFVAVGGYSYDTATYGDSEGFILHGNTIIDVSRGAANIYYHTYGLDDQAGAATEFLDLTGLADYRCGLYHAGKYVHLVALTGKVTETFLCPSGITYSVEAELEYSSISFDAQGGASQHGEVLDTVNGHHAAISVVEMSSYSHCGANPDTGVMNFFFRYHRHWSTDNCPVGPFPSADFEEWHRYIVTLSGGGLGLSEYEYDGIYTDVAFCLGPSDYSFSSRIDPMSLIGESGDPNWVPDNPPVTPYLFHWNTLGSSAVGTFYQGTDPGTYPTEGAGQRNDNQPLLISSARTVGLYWHNFWYTTGGDLYLDQTTTFTGASTKLLPVHGFIGKWPVHHEEGRWVIFGPNTYVETLGPNWQVV